MVQSCGGEAKKNYERNIQQMINWQARSITGMYSSTPVHPLLCEAGLIPTSILLDYRQGRYTHRLLSLHDSRPTKKILPISLREGDRGFQPGEVPENARPNLYGQWLAWQITTDHSIDRAEGVEPVTHLASYNSLEPEVIIKSKKEAIEEARKNNPGLILWTDGSKLDQGQVAAAVCWEEKSTTKWKEKSIFLGKNKEILDAELWVIFEALIIAEKMANSRASVTIFSDSQKALKAIAPPFTSEENRFLRSQVY